MSIANTRLNEIIQDGHANRNAAEALLTGALVYLEAIPTLARTRADTVIAACIRYYLK